MVKIVETDERITLEKQLDEDVGPIVVMNKFNLSSAHICLKGQLSIMNADLFGNNHSILKISLKSDF